MVQWHWRKHPKKAKKRREAGTTGRIRAWVGRARAACGAFWAKRDPLEVYLLLAGAGLAVFVLRCLVGGADVFLDFFHLRGTEFLSDFFDPLRDASQGARVYTERHVIYPPLLNLLLALLARLLPAAYRSAPAAEAGTWREYPGAMLTYLVFAALAMALVAALVLREQVPAKKRGGLVFLVLASCPLLFWLERGNTVLLVLPLLLLYEQNYDSPTPAARELGLLALALAFALKLYPAIFGLPLLADRRWRDALRCALYGILLFLIPSLAYGGIGTVVGSIVKDLFSFSAKQTANGLFFFAPLGITGTATRVLVGVLLVLAGVFLVGFALICRKTHLTLALAAAVLLSIPSIFSCYNCMLLLPALLLFLRRERLRTVRQALWFLGMALPFTVYLPRAAADNFVIACLAAIYAAAVWELAATLWHRRRARPAAEIPPNG